MAEIPDKLIAVYAEAKGYQPKVQIEKPREQDEKGCPKPGPVEYEEINNPQSETEFVIEILMNVAKSHLADKAAEEARRTALANKKLLKI